MSWFRNRQHATEDTVVIANRTYLFFPQQQEAALLGKKVMVLDYVVPTPKGTSWGTVPPLTLTLLYLLNVFFLLVHGHFLMVTRSWWNLCQRGLHSKEADAPDGSAAHGDPGCPQVRLGVR